MATMTSGQFRKQQTRQSVWGPGANLPLSLRTGQPPKPNIGYEISATVTNVASTNVELGPCTLRSFIFHLPTFSNALP